MLTTGGGGGEKILTTAKIAWSSLHIPVSCFKSNIFYSTFVIFIGIAYAETVLGLLLRQHPGAERAAQLFTAGYSTQHCPSWYLTTYGTTLVAKVICPWMGDKVESGIGCRSGPPGYITYRLAGRYDKPMPESTLSPIQGLWIWILTTYDSISSQIHMSPKGGIYVVYSGIGLSYRPARLQRLAGRYDKYMPESTLSPSQRLWIWILTAYDNISSQIHMSLNGG